MAELTLSDREIIVDCFCGGGGASLGIAQAMGRHPDVAIDNSEKALATHAANSPGTLHINADMTELSPRSVLPRRPIGLLWASPSCTVFSLGRNGTKKAPCATTRELAWTVARWAKERRPRVVMMENVRRFEQWGRLNKNGQPNKKHAGETFERFVDSFRSLGYDIEWRALDAADYGVPQHRKRLFIIARNDGEPIRWPMPTHGDAVPYRTVRGCIDWQSPCWSVVDREPSLCEKTLRRIRLGIDKFGGQPFLTRCNNYAEKAYDYLVRSLDEPSLTVTTSDSTYLVRPELRDIIGMRQLSAREEARLMGFADSFALTGFAKQQRHCVGNAVCPPMAKALVLANATSPVYS